MTTRLSECDYNYLIPPKEVFDVVHSEHYIRHGEGKKSVRKIFACDKYYDDETKKLKEFEALIAKENVELPSDWTTVDTIRFMYAGKLDLKKSLKTLKQHLEWRQLPERGLLNAEAKKLLEEGYVYIAGRDKQFRPVIIVNGYKVDLKIIKLEDFLQALCFVLDTVRKYYFVPGKVENWIIFIENNNESVFNFPLKVIKSINDITAINYTSTLDKLFIVNPSSFLRRSWMFISNFIDPETATKIQMLGKSDYAKLLQQIDPDQLEVKYGGTLPEQQIHWPPVNTLGKPPHNYQEPKSPISASNEKVLIAGDQPSHGGSRIVVIEPTEEEIKGIHQDQLVEANTNAVQNSNNKSQDGSPGIVEPALKKQEEQQQLVEKRASGGIHHENFATFGNAGTKNEDSSLQPLSEVRFTNVDGGSSTTRFREPDQPKEVVEQGGFSGNAPVETKKAKNVNTVNNAIFEHDDEEIKAVREENVNIGLLEGYDTQRNSRAANMTFGGEISETSQLQSAKLKGEANAGHIVVERESVKVGGFCGMCKQSKTGTSDSEQNNCNIF